VHADGNHGTLLQDGWKATRIRVVMAVLAHIAFSGGTQILNDTSISPLFILFWQAAVDGALLIYVRYLLHHALLEEAAEDILAYRHLPLDHQRQLHSTNPLERLNKEIKRRSNVVGIFPNPAAVIRLVGAILLEQDDEWTVAERRYFSAESMKQLTTPTLSTTAQEILAAIA